MTAAARRRWSSSDGDCLEEARRSGDDGGRTRDRQYRSPTGSSRRSCTRTSSCPDAGRAARPGGAGAGGRSRGRPARLEDIEALARHWSLGGDQRKGARYLVAAGDWARGLYANADAIQHYERALERSRCAPAAADGGLGGARAPGRPPRPDLGRRAAALGDYEIVEAGTAAVPATPADAGPDSPQDGGLHWDAGERGGALRCFEAGLALLEDQPEHIELAHLYQEMGRLAFRSGDSQGPIAWAERALAQAERLAAAPALGARTAPRRPAAVAQAYNTLGVALARLGGSGRRSRTSSGAWPWPRTHGLLQAACRGLREPQRALQHARSRARHRDLRRGPRDGQEDRRPRPSSRASTRISRWPTARSRTAATSRASARRRPPSTSTASSGSSTTWRCRSSCSGRSTSVTVIPRWRSATIRKRWPSSRSRRAPALFPCYDGLATLHLDLATTCTRPRSSCRRRSRCASGPGSSRTRSWCCRSWIEERLMNPAETRPPLAPGEPAPDFVLPSGARCWHRVPRRLPGEEPGPAGPLPGTLLPVLPAARRAAQRHSREARGRWESRRSA